MSNPFIRDPKRWLALLIAVVAFAIVVILAQLIWPAGGDWVALALLVVVIAGRILYLRRKYRRDGIPPELAARMDEREQKRRP